MDKEKIDTIANDKKEKLIKNGESLEKIDYILEFLNDDMCFFKTDINIAVPILLYLGILEDQIKEVYFELISFKNFKSENKVRLAIDPDDTTGKQII